MSADGEAPFPFEDVEEVEAVAEGDGVEAGTAGAGTRGSAVSKRVRLARDVALEVHALRASLAEALESFGARAHGQLATTSRRLEQAVAGESGVRLPSTKALAAALKELRSLKLKPRKGRAKDLNRIDKALEQIAELSQDP